MANIEVKFGTGAGLPDVQERGVVYFNSTDKSIHLNGEEFGLSEKRAKGLFASKSHVHVDIERSIAEIRNELSMEITAQDVQDMLDGVYESGGNDSPDGLNNSYCLMVRKYGDLDPRAQSFYGSRELIREIGSHLKMAVVRGQGDYDMLAPCRITKSQDGKDIKIDGSDGDVLCVTDCKMYIYAEKIEASDGALEIFGLGLSPVTLFGKEAVGYEPFGMAADACVYAKLDANNAPGIKIEDIRAQLHCIYNEQVNGDYSKPVAAYTSSYKTSGAGYSKGSYNTLNEILHAQAKNEDPNTNYPYMGLYYRFVEIWMAAAKCELGTMDISATNLLGPGATSTSIANASTWADEAITAGSGVKFRAADGTEKIVSIYHDRALELPDGTTSYSSYGLDSFYSCSLLPALTPHRMIDTIFATGNFMYIGDPDAVFDESGQVHFDINVSTGENMEDGQRYYIVRGCPGAQSFESEVMTGVLNCYIAMTPVEGLKGVGLDLAGGRVIHKLSTLLYRGFTWSTGHWIWMQGFHYVIHTPDTDTFETERYVSSIIQRDPSKIVPWKSGKSYYCIEADGDTDYEEGYEQVPDIFSYRSGWGKSSNPSISLFCYPDLGASQHTGCSAYTWRDQSWSGNLNRGYKSVNASAFGGSGRNTYASAGSLFGAHSVACTDAGFAASLSIIDYRKQ